MRRRIQESIDAAPSQKSFTGVLSPRGNNRADIGVILLALVRPMATDSESAVHHDSWARAGVGDYDRVYHCERYNRQNPAIAIGGQIWPSRRRQHVQTLSLGLWSGHEAVFGNIALECLVGIEGPIADLYAGKRASRCRQAPERAYAYTKQCRSFPVLEQQLLRRVRVCVHFLAPRYW